MGACINCTLNDGTARSCPVMFVMIGGCNGGKPGQHAGRCSHMMLSNIPGMISQSKKKRCCAAQWMTGHPWPVKCSGLGVYRTNSAGVKITKVENIGLT